MVFCLLFRKMLLFLDTETTGLAPGNICQLSYVMQSDSGVIAKNMFFKVDHVPKEAVAIHGFSAEKLKVLSNGSTFKDRIEEIYMNTKEEFIHEGLIDEEFENNELEI